jgi:hypothetical protein
VARDGRTGGIATNAAYVQQLEIEGGRIVGTAIGIQDAGAMNVKIRGLTLQNRVNYDCTEILPTTLEYVDVLNVPLAGFPKTYIAYGRGAVWSGSGAFPLVQHSPWTVQRGSRHLIRNWQRHQGEDYRLFEPQQLASAAAWPSQDEYTYHYNCPEADLTMGQCWDRFGLGFNGETIADAEAVHLDGVVNGLAHVGTTPALGPPRFIVTDPTPRTAAHVEIDRLGPFITVYGVVTGAKAGVSDDVKVSVDGGAAFLVSAATTFLGGDSRRFQVRGTSVGLHTVRTWRLTTTGAIVPSSEMTFHYSVGAVTDPPAPPPLPPSPLPPPPSGRSPQ